VPTFILEISTWWCASVFFSSSFRNPVRCDGTRRKNSWHYFLDTIISYSLANTWRDRVFASVIGFKPIDCCSRRIVCIKSYIMTKGKNHGSTRLLMMVWLIFRDSIDSRRTTIVRPFIGTRIEYSRTMSNYYGCLRADIARPFFVTLKLHQCQEAGRVVCVTKVSTVWGDAWNLRQDVSLQSGLPGSIELWNVILTLFLSIDVNKLAIWFKNQSIFFYTKSIILLKYLKI